MVTGQKQLPRKAQQRLTIAIGHDSRLTAEPIKQALVDTFLSLGIQVIDVGLATTPAMFMATQFPTFQCDAAIMITASHLPYYFNGLKFFTAEGGAEKEDIRYILSHTDPLTANENGTLMKQELLPIYAEHLVEKSAKEFIRQKRNLYRAFELSLMRVMGLGASLRSRFFKFWALIRRDHSFRTRWAFS